jgi:hypothetical protein
MGLLRFPATLLPCNRAALIQCVRASLFLQLDVQSVNFILANKQAQETTEEQAPLG